MAFTFYFIKNQWNKNRILFFAPVTTETVTLGIIVEVSALSSYHVFEACETAQGTPSRNFDEFESNQSKALNQWYVTCLDVY